MSIHLVRITRTQCLCKHFSLLVPKREVAVLRVPQSHLTKVRWFGFRGPNRKHLRSSTEASSSSLETISILIKNTLYYVLFSNFSTIHHVLDKKLEPSEVLLEDFFSFQSPFLDFFPTALLHGTSWHRLTTSRRIIFEHPPRHTSQPTAEAKAGSRHWISHEER